MLHGFIGLVEIARSIAAEVMLEGALEHARPLRARMPMMRQSYPGCRFQHEDPAALFARHVHRAPMHPASDPSPRSHDILRKRCWKIAREGIARRLHGREVGLSPFDLRPRTLQSIGANSRRFETL